MDQHSEAFQRALLSYAEAHTSPEEDYLYDLRRATYLKTLAPQMLSGHLQGQLLTMISRMIRPRYIVEIGTFTGYATLCLAKGLAEGGQIITLEANRELTHISQPHWDRSPYSGMIDQRFGDAKELVQELEGGIDLVFIDAGKRDYQTYYDTVIDKVRAGGFILADNVLWNGKVIYQAGDAVTDALLAFNDMVARDPRVEQMILPIRDGVQVIYKRP